MNLSISLDSYLELEKIAEKLFPLRGFMTEEDFISVVERNETK